MSNETGSNKKFVFNVPSFLIGEISGLIVGGLVLFFVLGGPDMGDPVVAKYQGKSVRGSEVFGSIKTRLYDLEEEMFRAKEQAINEFVEQRILENEARKQNLSVEQLLDKNTGGAVADVTDKEVEEFLSSKNLSLNDPRIRKDDVKEYLKYRQKYEKRQGFVTSLKASSNFQVMLKEPESPKLNPSTDGYPSWGNKNAKVTIVEFSDYQCPFCSRALPILDKIKKEYGPDKVRVVFRDMPLPSHGRAMPASLSAHCANEQGKFWEMHDKLFSNQSKLEDADLKSYAKDISLDVGKFNECFDAKKHRELVERSAREAQVLGIQATPTFIINGVILQGAQPFEKFKEKIDRALRG